VVPKSKPLPTYPEASFSSNPYRKCVEGAKERYVGIKYSTGDLTCDVITVLEAVTWVK